MSLNQATRPRHNQPAESQPSAGGTSEGAPHRSALAGLRIADLTIITAGASATQILADLGAEVIKVEAGRYPDPFRHWGAGLAQPEALERPWDASPPFNSVNRNKRGITLDIKHPAGREAFLKLVAISDVVAENFRRGVMERLGLGFEQLLEVKPDLVMVSLSSQGSSGPESGYSSYGSTLDSLSGIMSVTGYGPDAPIWSSNDVNYPDQVVSIFGAGAILMGLRQRQQTGRGVYIDLSQRELVTSMVGEVMLDYSVNGRVGQPNGNHDRSMTPHGVYRCQGDDDWLAIAVENDSQWTALARAIGRPELADDPRYATLPARWERVDELDQLIEAWSAQQDKRAAMELLQRAGVPSGAVLNGAEMLDDPQFLARGFYQRVEHPLAGPQLQRTWPFRFSDTPAEISRPAPCLGQHTDEVLREVLDYTPAQIDELREAGVTLADPRGFTRGR